MSKSILAIGLVVVAIAIPFAAPAIAAAIGVSAAVVTAVATVGLAIAANVLLGPSLPKMPTSLQDGGRSRLTATLDVRAPRKIVFGDTAGATDVRYQTFTGADQEYMEMIVCVASHTVNLIYELWLDNELAWSSAGGTQGRYVGYLTVVSKVSPNASNGIAIDAVWTATATLTGCPYLHLKCKLTDNSDTDKSPFATGVTSRMTVRTQGALVYDPRLDSTVTGGSGAHRADNQATWAWSANASRNAALQLLFFLLGWKINGKLAVGMGLPPARIDLPSFITAANVCDESVTKSAANGGGTEPRYRGDGVVNESDDRNAIIETLCATMNAIVRDNGGKLSLTVLKNDLASHVASLTEDDVLDSMEWDQTPDISQIFNVTRGQRIDPSNNSLYQPVEYDEVSLPSNDGIDRVDTFDLPLVQSHGQAVRLAKQRLQRAQYQGKLRLAGKPSWWQTSVGDVVQFSHVTYGWANKLFRVAGQKISRTGETEVVLVEENAAIYAWDNSEAAPVTPGAPTIYEPTNLPIVQDGHNGSSGKGTNELKDTQFGRRWTRSAGANRRINNASLGYARGNEFWYCELNPSTSAVVSAKSELVPVTPGQRIYFKIDAQRGTALGTGSRLNMGHEWILGDGTTTTGTPAEGAQQTPSTLTAGAAPKSIYWSDVAPANAAFVRIKPYTPALASSSGTFRVEAPVISKVDLGGTASIGAGPDVYEAQYSASGVAESGELPFSLDYVLYLGGVAQTSGITWTYKVLSGGINSKTNASGNQAMSGTGTGSLTVNTLDQDSSDILITASASNGSVATKTVTLKKKYATATGGTGGSSGDSASQTSGFTGFSTTSFTVITNTLTYTTPAGNTTNTVTFNLSCRPSSTGGTGTWGVEVKIQRLVSGTWTDMGAVMSGNSEVDVSDETGNIIRLAYVASGTRQATGLTAGTQQSYRAVARLTSGSRAHTVTGSISVAAP